MNDNNNREIALEKEIHTIKLAQTISSLFVQISASNNHIVASNSK